MMLLWPVLSCAWISRTWCRSCAREMPSSGPGGGDSGGLGRLGDVKWTAHGDISSYWLAIVDEFRDNVILACEVRTASEGECRPTTELALLTRVKPSTCARARAYVQMQASSRAPAACLRRMIRDREAGRTVATSIAREQAQAGQLIALMPLVPSESEEDRWGDAPSTVQGRSGAAILFCRLGRRRIVCRDMVRRRRRGERSRRARALCSCKRRSSR